MEEKPVLLSPYEPQELANINRRVKGRAVLMIAVRKKNFCINANTRMQRFHGQ